MPTLPYSIADAEEVMSQRRNLLLIARATAVEHGRQDRETMLRLRMAVSDAFQLATRTGGYADDAMWYRLATLLATERGMVQP